MVARKNNLDYSSVPTNAEIENNSNQKKYTVNRTPRGDLVISKLICALLVLIAMILIAAAALLTYFLLVPHCSSEATPEALRKASISNVPVRLSRSVHPLHYRLQIIPFLQEGNFTTNGAVQITLNVSETTNRIELNVNDLHIEKQSVVVKKISDGKQLEISDQKYENESQKYIISLNDNLEEGEQYEVDIKYSGRLNDYMQGFYRSSYIDSNSKENRWIASTQFSPTDARRAFPCLDEPSFKAKFTISIARPSNLTSLSNMPKRESVVIVDKKNWIWDHFKETPQMSSYLIAFVVSDLQPFRFNSSEKLFTIWSRRDALDQTRFAMEIGPKILQYFERYFGIDYPLPKIDMVAVPDFGFNAMENWGLITFRESSLLFDEKISTIDDKRSVATVTAHELAHQWFGNLVTPKWWDDLWLKEGFANYLKYYGVNFVYSDWNILNEFIMSEVHESMKIDSLKSTHPLTYDVHSTDEIRQMFDTITYSKGASIIRMMNHFLGEKTFKAGLVKYLHSFSYSNAKRDDLWKVLTEQAHEDGNLHEKLSIKEIMDSWTVQSGFPVITAVRNDKRVDVSQRRFSFDKNSSDASLWWVPLSFSTDIRNELDDTSPKQWLKGETGKTFEIEAQNWWLVNPHQTGYYIVNYDEKNWRALLDNLMSFPPTIKAQLISDSMDLARAGLLDYDIAFKMVKKHSLEDKDITFLPLQTAFDKLEYLYNVLYSTPAFGDLDIFVSVIFSFAFDNVDFEDSPSHPYLVQRIRRSVLKWACKRPESRCVATARHRYRNLMSGQGSQEIITANTQETVFCTAIREGAEPEWNYAYEQYLSTTSISEKETILNALGCASKPWLLSRYLDYMLKNDSGIRKQDGPRVFRAVASNYIGYNIALNFLRTNWNLINEYYGSAFNTISKMVDDLTIFMNTESQLEELYKFKNENWESLGSSERAFDNAIEKVKNNINWMNMNYRSVEKWLQDHNDHYII